MGSLQGLRELSEGLQGPQEVSDVSIDVEESEKASKDLVEPYRRTDGAKTVQQGQAYRSPSGAPD